MLLHEATFDDELQGDAEAKKHSTTSEAIGVGLAMGARRVILTHFSQRYQKIPIMDKLGLKHIRLETAEENVESDIPVGTEVESLPTPEDVVMQDTGDLEEAARSSGLTNNRQDGEHSVEPQVEALRSTGIRTRKAKSRTHSRHNSQSESEVVIVPETAKQMKVCVAFDYMRIKVKEIAHMEKFTPALLELYQQDEEADESATIRQEPDEVERKTKRKDESDDESSKGNKKKSNEEINRGKSNRQIQKEQRSTNHPEKDQSEGKHNPDVGNTASMRLTLGLIPLKNQHQWEFIDIFCGEEKDAEKRHARIGLYLASLNETNKDFQKFHRTYEYIVRSIAYTTLAISGKFEEFCKVVGQRNPPIRRRTRRLVTRKRSTSATDSVTNSTPWKSMQERRLRMASRKSRIVSNGQPSIQMYGINHTAFRKCGGTSPVHEKRMVQSPLIPPTLKHPISKITGIIESHREEQSPELVHSTSAMMGTRIRVGSGRYGRTIYTEKMNSLSPINEATTAISTASTKPEMKRRILPTKKPRERLSFPMAAIPTATRITRKKSPGARSRLQPNWDLTLQSVANEIEGDLREAQHTASYRV